MRRADRRTYWLQELSRLKRAGIDVKQLANDHFRINGEIDFYPVHAIYHNLQNNKRGKITNNLLGFARTACANNYKYRQEFTPRRVVIHMPDD